MEKVLLCRVGSGYGTTVSHLPLPQVIFYRIEEYLANSPENELSWDEALVL